MDTAPRASNRASSIAQSIGVLFHHNYHTQRPRPRGESHMKDSLLVLLPRGLLLLLLPVAVRSSNSNEHVCRHAPMLPPLFHNFMYGRRALATWRGFRREERFRVSAHRLLEPQQRAPCGREYGRGDERGLGYVTPRRRGRGRGREERGLHNSTPNWKVFFFLLTLLITQLWHHQFQTRYTS